MYKTKIKSDLIQATLNSINFLSKISFGLNDLSPKI